MIVCGVNANHCVLYFITKLLQSNKGHDELNSFIGQKVEEYIIEIVFIYCDFAALQQILRWWRLDQLRTHHHRIRCIFLFVVQINDYDVCFILNFIITLYILTNCIVTWINKKRKLNLLLWRPQHSHLCFKRLWQPLLVLFQEICKERKINH